ARAAAAILGGPAAHSPGGVVLLAGNHDLSRVMELAFQTDEGFARARERAEEIGRLARPEAGARDEAALHAAREAFFRDFPGLPSARVVRRDFAGFREEQRATVQALLLA